MNSTKLDAFRTRDGAATKARRPSPGWDRIAATESWRARILRIRVQIADKLVRDDS